MGVDAVAPVEEKSAMMYKNRAVLAGAALLALSGCGIFKGGGKKTPVLGDRVPILMAEIRSHLRQEPGRCAGRCCLRPRRMTDWPQPGGNALKSMGQLAPRCHAHARLERSRSMAAPTASGSPRRRSSPTAGSMRWTSDANVRAFTADGGAQVWTTNIAKGDKKTQERPFRRRRQLRWRQGLCDAMVSAMWWRWMPRRVPDLCA